MILTIICIFKSKIRWAEHVAHQSFGGKKTERKRTLGTLGLRWENNIKTDIK